MNVPAIDLRRVYLVARRDFLGYVKTWGFWISFFLPFIFGALGFVFATLDINVEPLRYETILDDTGKYQVEIEQMHRDGQAGRIFEVLDGLEENNFITETQSQELKDIYTKDGTAGIEAYVKENYPGVGNQFKLPSERLVFIDPPANSINALRPFVSGEKQVNYEGESIKLNGVMHLYEKDGRVQADYWSANINSSDVKDITRRYFREKSSDRYLASGGLTLEGLNEARADGMIMGSFDPTKEITSETDSQAVTITDRIPFYVAGIITVILWLTIFSGAYMLLTSMLEEKLNKLLEMMLATTRFSEIIFGKLLGVAALTITAMLPYIGFGLLVVIASFFVGDAAVAEGLAQAFTPKLIIFSIIFLILGYVFYGAFFIALGALASSMQDAQTLTTPIMLVLTACILVVPVGLESPDSPIITIASWFPLSAPFAAIVRIPLDPPWWELTLSALFVFICAMGVIWVAGRIFRYGVLSGAGVKSVQLWFSRVILRRKPSA